MKTVFSDYNRKYAYNGAFYVYYDTNGIIRYLRSADDFISGNAAAPGKELCGMLIYIILITVFVLFLSAW